MVYFFVRLLVAMGLGLALVGQPLSVGQANPLGQQVQPPAGIILDNGVMEGVPSIVVEVSARPQTAVPGLEDTLAQIYQAYRARDAETLATFAGLRHIDLKAQTARVVLVMAKDLSDELTLRTVVETVTLEDGRLAQIQHGQVSGIPPDLLAALTRLGVVYETAYRDLVQVVAPFDSLAALAQIEGVTYVRLPLDAVETDMPARPAAQAGPRVGSQTSEGVNLTNTNTWQGAGHNGTGVSLAVYDFGFTGWATRQSTGDLPAGAVLKDFSSTYSFSPDTPNNEHGTACAEITYDMAPGATHYLYAFGTDVEFGNAVTDYINNVSGKRVASMSIGWVNAGPYDGTGSINNTVNSAQAAGILFAVSAGNNQRTHWSGTATQYGSGDSVAFGTGNIEGYGPVAGSLYNIPSGVQVTAFLEWNDWNAGRNGNQNHIDYDLYLYRYSAGWTLVASSTNNQCSSSAPPTEMINYTVPSGGPYNYGLVIQRFQGSGSCPNSFGHWLNLHSFLSAGANNLFWYTNYCNSIMIPADGDSAVAVGATFWNEDGTAPNYGLEPFSSLGPRNAAGGANPGTTVSKPDVVAPDGVSGVTYGASNGVNYAGGGTGFWGTSAAAPHVAGLAAVSWSGRPDYSMTQQRNYIQTQAVYKADGGSCGGSRSPESGTQNNRYGWGRIQLGSLPVAGLWDGGGSTNNWSEAANWDNGAVPGSSTPILFNATSTKNAVVNSNVTVASLTMDSGYTGSVTLGGTLTDNGNLTINSGTLDVSASNYAISVAGDFSRSGSGAFNPHSGTVTFAGGAQALNGLTTLYNMTVNNGSTVTPNGNLTTNNNLQVNDGGALNMGTNNLTVTGVGRAISTHQNVVTGGTVYTFLGANGLTIDPVNNALPLGDTYVIIRDHPGGTGCTSDPTRPSITRCYYIYPANASGRNATVRFYFNDSHLNGRTCANLKAWHWNSGTNSWELAGGSGGTATCNPGGTSYVTVTGVSSFSEFVLTDQAAGPTAVTLQRVNAASATGVWTLAALAALSALGLGLIMVRRRRGG